MHDVHATGCSYLFDDHENDDDMERPESHNQSARRRTSKKQQSSQHKHQHLPELDVEQMNPSQPQNPASASGVASFGTPEKQSLTPLNIGFPTGHTTLTQKKECPISIGFLIGSKSLNGSHSSRFHQIDACFFVSCMFIIIIYRTKKS
jgi:hypothetical protein